MPLSASLPLFISKKVEYVKLMASIEQSKGPHREAECVQGILQAVKLVKYVPEDQALEIKQILDQNLPEPCVNTIMLLVDSKVNLTAATASGAPNYSAEKQEHKFMDNYLTEEQ